MFYSPMCSANIYRASIIYTFIWALDVQCEEDHVLTLMKLPFQVIVSFYFLSLPPEYEVLCIMSKMHKDTRKRVLNKGAV